MGCREAELPLESCGGTLGPPDRSRRHSAACLGSRGTYARGWGDRKAGPRTPQPQAARHASCGGAPNGRQGALRAPARPPPGRRGRVLPAAAAAAAAWAAPCPRWTSRRRRRELDADGARAGPWGSSASRTRSALLPLPAFSLQGPAPPPREPGDVRPRQGLSPELPRLPPRPTPRSPQPSRCPWGPGDRQRHCESTLQLGPQSGAPSATPPLKPGIPPLPPPPPPVLLRPAP